MLLPTFTFRAKLSAAVVAVLLAAVHVNCQRESTPAFFQTGYNTTDPLGATERVTFHFQNGNLVIYQKWESGKQSTFTVVAPDITSIRVSTPRIGESKCVLMIWQKSAGLGVIPFNSKDDATEAAKYFQRLAGVPISTDNASSEPATPVSTSTAPSSEATPQEFICPPQTTRSCGSYMDLVNHSDSEMLRYKFAATTSFVMVCFSTEGYDKFHIISYKLSTDKDEFFSLRTFEDGVASNSFYGKAKWFSPTFGVIQPLMTADVMSGTITDAEIDFSTAYENVSKKKTTFSFSERQSTGKYVEKYVFADDKGQSKMIQFTGVCSQLH